LDTVSFDGRVLLREFLEKSYPSSQVMEISAREGTGIESWLLAALSADPITSNNKKMDLVYETYANAEAEMGWLNAKTRLTSDNWINGNDVLFDLGKKIKDCITLEGGEIGHLKLFLESGGEASKISCVGVHQPIDIDSEFRQPIRSGELTINIRATLSPEVLKEMTLESIKRLEKGHKLNVESPKIDAFRPGYPTPTYRL